MEAVGLSMAIFGTADLCFNYGKKLIDICTSFKNAETEIDERVLYVKTYWKRTSIQLNFLKQIWKMLDEEHQNIQDQILQMLVRKLETATSKLEKLLKKAPLDPIQPANYQWAKVKRFKYIFVKKHLDEIIQEFVSWQKLFDPTWFLILRVSNPLIDQELDRDRPAVSLLPGVRNFRRAAGGKPLQNKSVFLPEAGLNYSTLRNISFSSAKVAQRNDSGKWVLIDSVPCDPEGDVNLQTQDVRELARKLSCTAQLDLGILQCRGVIRVIKPGSRKPTSFEFIFPIPEGLSDKPKSLRDYLSSQVNHTLTDRLRIANQLAKSISYIHSLGFVHKMIRPENILAFQDNKSALGSMFLVGFEKFRMADGQTRRLGNSAWEINLYHHPHRQGPNPEESYIMQHDIYSLGVVLLEIGIWESFVSYKNNETARIPGTSLGIHSGNVVFKKPILVKEHLVALAKDVLPKRMGERYKDIVVNCLTCLDEDNMDFGDQGEFEDVDGVLVGVRYIEKVSGHNFQTESLLTTNLDTAKTGRDNRITSLYLGLFCANQYTNDRVDQSVAQTY
ncbi:hypothetical protein NHQ30_002476 [Ciborinia camelliae]|nr:hypothetical protein NHQ30_002476 [Ciborinia camelliae]